MIAGNGYLLHHCGVPEHVLQQHPKLSPKTCLIISLLAMNPLKRNNEMDVSEKESLAP